MEKQDYTDQQKQKLGYLYQIEWYQQCGYQIDKHLTIDNDLNEIKIQHIKIKRQLERENSIKTRNYVKEFGMLFGVKLTETQIDSFLSDPEGTHKLVEILLQSKK